jgi:hypothetical protein
MQDCAVAPDAGTTKPGGVMGPVRSMEDNSDQERGAGSAADASVKYYDAPSP